MIATMNNGSQEFITWHVDFFQKIKFRSQERYIGNNICEISITLPMNVHKDWSHSMCIVYSIYVDNKENN